VSSPTAQTQNVQAKKKKEKKKKMNSKFGKSVI
jgi:hypothetical protein